MADGQQAPGADGVGGPHRAEREHLLVAPAPHGISAAVTVYGLPGMAGRVPTFLVNVDGVAAQDVAARLAEDQIGVWAHDSWYSLDLYRRLGYSGKSVRIGFIHYNPADEVDRLVSALTRIRG